MMKILVMASDSGERFWPLSAKKNLTATILDFL